MTKTPRSMIARIAGYAAILCAAFAVAAHPASAAWHEASSDHFVIYANDSEKDIRRFSENLERFHKAMEQLTGRTVGKPSPSNRVTIFVVGSAGKVRKLAGSRYAAGFYVPRAGASRAFVQNIRNTNGYPDFATIVLLHEYAHHFLISSTRFELPRWMSEGAAEFFAAATFEKDGGVLMGRVARHRAGELMRAQDVTVRELMDPELYEERHGNRYTAFYGRSWLLYHYLLFNPARNRQLGEYGNAVISGMSPIEAGEKVFGDLDQLQREIDEYKMQRGFMMLPMKPEELPVGPITIRRLPEGEAKVMPLRIQSQRGVTRDEAIKLVDDVRDLAARYRDDPGVLAALAEAEHDAGNDAEAIAAADRALALDPGRVNAYVQKGFSLFRIASETEGAEREPAYDRAMEPFAALNQIENDHPLPLIHYYRSYAERGVTPPENARKALERAAQLAPFDKALWLNVGMMWLDEGKIALARQAFQPIAYNPHGGRQATRTRKLLLALSNIEEGTRISQRDLGADASDDADGADAEGEDGEGEDGDDISAQDAGAEDTSARDTGL